MKKFLALLVVLTVGASVLFASGNKEEATSEPAVKVTPINIIVPGDRPKDIDLVIEKIEAEVAGEIGPVDLTVEFIPFSDYKTKIALKVAAKEHMDLVFDPAWLNFYEMQAQGAFIPLNDIIPELSFFGDPANINDTIWGAVSVGADIYGLPALENNYVKRADRGSLAVRADLMEKYAPNGITTGPEFLEFCKTVKANEPQVLVLNAEREGSLPLSPAVLFGQEGTATATWGELNTGLSLYLDPNKSGAPEVFSAVFTKEFENDVKAAIKLQDMNLVTFEEVSDKRASFVSGRMAFIGADKDDYAMSIYPQVKDTFGVDWVRLDKKEQGVLMRASGNWFCISTQSKTPVVAAKFVNWIMSSQANYELWAYGIEGTHYDIKNGAIAKITPEKKNYEMLWWYIFNRNHLRQDMSATPDAEDYLNWANVNSNSLANPSIGFPWDQEPIKSEIAQMNAVASEFGGLALGLNPVTDIEEYRKQLNNAGLQTVLDETNRQLAAWYASK
ncbi:MAG: ABC transporter substrate-binding protein [Spirochaetaceae bacterium]